MAETIAVCPPQYRERLVAKGKWDGFCHLRADYAVRYPNRSPEQALKRALIYYLGPNFDGSADAVIAKHKAELAEQREHTQTIREDLRRDGPASKVPCLAPLALMDVPADIAKPPLATVNKKPRPPKPRENVDKTVESPVLRNKDLPETYYTAGAAHVKEAVLWVASNLSKPEVRARQAPNSLAWSLLEWAQESGNRNEFYRAFLTRLLPSRTQLEQLERFDDDGHKQLELIDRLLDQIGERRTVVN